MPSRGTAPDGLLGGVATVEHLMSALSGLEITDAEIELSYPELPALDGSAAGFVAALAAAGVDELGLAADRALPVEAITVTDRGAWIRVQAQFYARPRSAVARETRRQLREEHRTVGHFHPVLSTLGGGGGGKAFS